MAPVEPLYFPVILLARISTLYVSPIALPEITVLKGQKAKENKDNSRI